MRGALLREPGLGVVDELLRLRGLAEDLPDRQRRVLPRDAVVLLPGWLRDDRGDLGQRRVLLVGQTRVQPDDQVRGQLGDLLVGDPVGLVEQRRLGRPAERRLGPGEDAAVDVEEVAGRDRDLSASCSLRPTSTTRWGSAVISVLPYLCSIVTGYAPAAADGASDAGPKAGADGAGEPQAVVPRVRARARAAPQRSRRAGV